MENVVINVNGKEYRAVSASSDYVLIRSYGAGVFFGELIEKEHHSARAIVKLNRCRRIWWWGGNKFTLSAIATEGTNEAKLSVETNDHIVFDVIEIIPLSKEAKERLYAIKAHTP